MSATGGDDVFHVVATPASHLSADAIVAVDVATILDGVVVADEAGVQGGKVGLIGSD